MLTLPELYAVAVMQSLALRETLNTISGLESVARGTSPTIGCDVLLMWAFEAGQAADYCASQFAPDHKNPAAKP